jgi:AMP phosphorylase
VEIARALGTPKIKEAGIYMEKMVGEKVKKGDLLMTLYTTTKDRLEDGIKAVDLKELYEI